MKIIFVRHGKDDNNYRGGWSKMDLIPEGIEQTSFACRVPGRNDQPANRSAANLHKKY